MRLVRAAAAAIVAMAVGALPVVIDRCVESCGMDQTAPVGAPSCHHTPSSSPHIASAPVPCGHDHRGVRAIAAASISNDFASAFNAVIPVAHQPIAFASAGEPSLRGSPPHAVTVNRSTLPLRV
jgi:hypothetical protein